MENHLPYRKATLLIFLCLLSILNFAQVKEQWLKRYNGPGNGGDGASSMAVDALGNKVVVANSQLL